VATALGYIMGFAFYIVMLLYGTQVMRGVMEEKTNRIAEVIISSVKPFQMMMGKIIGIGLVGLTQFVIWIVLGFFTQTIVSIIFGADISAHTQPLSNGAQAADVNKVAEILNSAASLPWAYLISCFLFFFIGGYFLYASLFAAVGSASGDEADQSLSFIVTLPVIISIILMTNSLEQPNGTLAVVASMIPFSAPIIMCSRLPFDPPLWQVAVSMLSLIAGFIFTTWLAGKIYRTGILMYGKKVTLKELGKWLMYKN
jgi:ABC-2 type transport system permease protein